MSTASHTMSAALRGLQAAVEAPQAPGVSSSGWRWTVRQRMTTVRDALMAETGTSADGWLAARGGSSFRERNVLLGRLGEMGTHVLEAPDVVIVRNDVTRLVADITRHVQRVSDLAFDELEQELGGSE